MSASAGLDAVAKLQVKDALRAQIEAEAAATLQTSQQEHDAAQLDQDSSHTIDDLSQSDEAGELTGLFEQRAAEQAARLKALEDLDFAPTTRVGPGAVISFGGQNYVVGVAAGPFEAAGVSYQGLATDAPIYGSIEGLEAGERFSFRDHDHVVDAVS